MERGLRTGVIKFFNSRKGYGCIVSADDREFYFGEHAVVRESCAPSPFLHRGQKVQFRTGSTAGGRDNASAVIRQPADSSPRVDLIGKIPISETISFRACTAELIADLQRDPRALFSLHPGRFEELVAAIFQSEGFETEIISSWNQSDGGVDLIAVRKQLDPVLRLAIQCKRYGVHRRVSIEPIRALAGVLDRFKAHAGVLATTGYFTAVAREEVRTSLWRISLRDYESILASLKRLSLIEQLSEALTKPWCKRAPNPGLAADG